MLSYPNNSSKLLPLLISYNKYSYITRIKKKYNLLNSEDIILLNNKFSEEKVGTINIKKIY